MRPRALASVVLVATLAFVLSPLLTDGFNGFAADQFPVPQENPPVQPAGYAFAIWGVIYLWLIISAGYGLWRAADDPDWQAMRLPLAISLIVGAFWIKAATEAPLLATVMIVVMAAAAIVALLRTGEARPWLLGRPIALYAGWLTAATGVAIGVTLAGHAILSAQAAALICLGGVLLVALAVQSTRPRQWAYPVAIIWALIGVIVSNLPAPNLPVIGLAALGITALTLRAGHSLWTGATS
ncbi:tryptophan-rich sensory protein [Pseudooceanicola sp.]|uniref:tryptophan-rich sensory protein n=1 Tax=Pseudooceanicola sp. TaxID=1914328 RepID=UPI0026159392|nr:tryptophan-rich sensory protein [Pseudooceanicola sp.]MDF1856569.1 tryptophan-rich sensory protein [Pseudooceanicola sp.]